MDGAVYKAVTDVDAVGAGEEPKSVDAASDEVPLAAAAEADSSLIIII